MNDSAILATGQVWMQRGIRTIDAVLKELLRDARRDVVMTVYIAVASREFLEMIHSLLVRGVQTHLLFNGWNAQQKRVRDGLANFASGMSGLHVYDFQNSPRSSLHAKAVAVDGRRAVIGSANISESAMLWNYELGVYVEGRAAETVSRLLYKLASSDKVGIIF